MGSKPKTSQQQGKKGIFGMGPGQSLAMAGNTGLATMEQKQAEQIQKGLKSLGQPSSFKSIGQNVDEVGSKYRRPADVDSYARDMQQLNEALAAGGKLFIGPDKNKRINLNKTGIKDDQGRTILSKQIPNLNAMAPTLGQLGGDIGRAITGYDSLQYTDPDKLGINKMEMVRSPGMVDAVAQIAVPGRVAGKIAKDLYGTAKNFLFPIEEEEEEDIFSSGADALGGAAILSANMKDKPKVGDEIDEFIRTIGDPYVDPYSSGADATRPAVANLNDIFSSGADAVDIGRNTLDGTRLDQVTEPIQQLPEFLTGSSGKDKPEILDLRNITGGGGNSGGGNQNQQQQDTDTDTDTDPSALELSIRRNLESAGFTLTEIDSILGDLGYQMGGLVPPEKGPMSAGVASLFKNK